MDAPVNGYRCGDCGGTGKDLPENVRVIAGDLPPCGRCKGTGRVDVHPLGVDAEYR